MEHLTDQQMYPLLTGEEALSRREQDHLAECAACRERWQSWHRLLIEMEIAGRSRPSHAQMAIYLDAFAHVQTQSIWERAVQRLTMQLTLDSRQQLALPGLRNASRGALIRSYRLLYSSEAADVELLVEADGLARRVEGEVLCLPPQTIVAPVLIELQPQIATPGQGIVTTESSDDGRFRLQNVAPGRYRLSISPLEGPWFDVEDIAIT